VQELIEVPLERPRRAAQFNSDEFQAIKQRLEMLIHPPAEESDDEVYPMVPLLTDVRDSIE
jgi:NitT/TauT family transport system ATP-binding protein